MLSRRWRKSTKSNPSGNCVFVRKTRRGNILVRESARPWFRTRTTPANWQAFIDGVKAGEFDL